MADINVVVNGANESSDPNVYDKLITKPMPEVPRSLKVRSVLKELKSFEESFHMTGKNVAAHACFWTPYNQTTMFGQSEANVMMHMRFDGTLGFPGGFVDIKDENILKGLTRELEEECNYSVVRQRPITTDDYHSTRVRENLILHFFVVQLTQEQYTDLEMHAIAAKEYGKEVFGTLRVPLYTMHNNYGGLPAFINNRFVGCAKQELIMALFSIGILSNDKVDELLHNSNNMKLAPNRM